MLACFTKYLTRISIQEQKCSFAFDMYVQNRGAAVLDWSLYDLVLSCLPGICIDIPGIHCSLL